MISALLLHLALTQVLYLPNRAREADRLHGARESNSFAFFEAFPSTGTGTSGVCSTTAPTGAKGEALTFTRASTAICTKTASGGLATTGIANGDLVSLSANVARVEYDSAGTLGLLVEATRTNLVLRSEEIDNVAWTKTGAVVAAPVVTANFATAPDGALTADRVQMAATDSSGAQGSYFTQASLGHSSSVTALSLYAKGNGTSGTFDVCTQETTVVCGTCSYVAGSWSRCAVIGGVAFTSTNIYIGNASLTALNGGVARAANDVLIWGVDDEPGAYATSYIPTVAATVTRAVEAPYFTMPSTEVQSIAVTLSTMGSIPSGNPRIMSAWKDGSNNLDTYVSGPGATPLHSFQTVSAVGKDLTAATNVPINSIARLVAWVIPSTTIGAIVASTETTSSAGVQGALTGVTRFYVGSYHGGTGFEIGGIFSRVCADPSSTRCR